MHGPTTPDGYDAALYGRDRTERIVGLHLVQGESGERMRVYRRLDPTTVEHADEPFYPFFFLSDIDLLRDFPRERFRFQELEGDGYFRHLVVFPDRNAYWDAVRHVERVTETNARRPAEIYFPGSPEQQYLMQTGRTLFKGMAFEDVHRLQLDIETYASEGGFPNAERPDDRIIIVSISDNRGWSRLIDVNSVPEQVLLREVVRLIQEKDPDVIEGHNCFPPGTPVLTPDGYRPIESLSEGDAVLSWGDALEVDRVTATFETHHRDDLVVLHAVYRGAIASTADHPHFGYTRGGGMGYQAASTFEPGDYLALPAIDPGPLTFDEDFYLAGLIFSDGHLSKKTNRVSFGNTDRALVHWVADRVGGQGTIRRRSNLPHQRDLYRLRTHDASLHARLRSLGIPAGDKSGAEAAVRVERVAAFGPSAVASFLAGVIDGDGHVSEANGAIHLACRPARGKQALLALAHHLGLVAGANATGLYLWPTATTAPRLRQIQSWLRVEYKRRARFDRPRRRVDELPYAAIEVLRPFIERLGLRYRDFPVPPTTVNYYLNGRTSIHRDTFAHLEATVDAAVPDAMRDEWQHAQRRLDALRAFHWFPIRQRERRPYAGPVYNIETRNHNYVAAGVLTHNCYAFDFPYLMTRCARHRVPFAIGRDGSVPRSFPSSMRFAERSVDFPALDVAGRHVIDTYFQVMSYDVFKRDLPAYGLKAAAKYFGFAPEDRTYVAGADIPRVWDEDPERLLAYALDDVIETERLSRHLSGSTFYLTQMVPMPYDACARTGPASKIEALFVREYLRQRQALPKADWGSQAVGGYTDVFVTGVVGPVVYADVESLYPSIMLNYDVQPAGDTLGLFPALLRTLTDLRFETKAAMREAASDEARGELDARQTAYKNIINSFYGNMGFGMAIFNDFAEADRVASTGQEILRTIIRTIRERGGTVVEVDTDGVLFVPPDGVRGDAEERAFVAGLGDAMPAGIRIGFDGRFQKMLSYKKKNYALLGYDGEMKFKGSSLVSRSSERFGRRFVREAVALLLDEDVAGLHALYLRTRDAILAHDWKGVQSFQRTETLKDTPERYLADVEAGKRTRAASYELAIRRVEATGQPIVKGDRISYYVTGSSANVTAFEHARLADAWDPASPDENTAYYLKRLDEFAAKFAPFFASDHDFRLVFSPEDLFGFDPSGITLQRTERTPEEVEDDVPF
jgi:DNA polymerase elongation subunit (family B)